MLFLIRLGCHGRTKNFINFAQYPAFKGNFSCFHEENKYKTRFLVHCRFYTKKLIYMKRRKLSKQIQSIVTASVKSQCF